MMVRVNETELTLGSCIEDYDRRLTESMTRKSYLKEQCGANDEEVGLEANLQLITYELQVLMDEELRLRDQDKIEFLRSQLEQLKDSDTAKSLAEKESEILNRWTR